MANYHMITHGGRFHCDEVTAYVLLKLIHPETKVERLTTIPPNIVDLAAHDTFVVDIGREYHPEAGLFDHHQGATYRTVSHADGDDYPSGCIYASAGLVWKHVGPLYCEARGVAGDLAEFIFEYVDRQLIRGIDAHDADSHYYATAWGGDMHSGHYEVKPTTLPEMVALMNATDVNDTEAQERAFGYTCLLVQRIVEQTIERAFIVGMQVMGMRTLAKHEDSVEKYRLERILDLTEDQEFTLDSYYVVEAASYFDEPQFIIARSQHPGAKFSLLAIPEVWGRRQNRLDIERQPGFEGFIHLGKFIAGSDSVAELRELAEWNIKELGTLRF